MISKDEVLTLPNDPENYHVERTVSTDKTDKFCQAICAFSNDVPHSGKKGYFIIGAADDGTISGIRSDGNIQPFPGHERGEIHLPEISWLSRSPLTNIPRSNTKEDMDTNRAAERCRIGDGRTGIGGATSGEYPPFRDTPLHRLNVGRSETGPVQEHLSSGRHG